MGYTGSNGLQNPPRAAERGRIVLKATMLALAIVLGATAAHAADACYQGNGAILVFKKFKMPRAGDCQPITGFQQNSDCTLTGTACGTSDGSNLVHFNFNFICHFEGFGTYDFFTDRMVQTGDGQFCQPDLSTGRYSCPTFIVSRVTCPTTETFTQF